MKEDNLSVDNEVMMVIPKKITVSSAGSRKNQAITGRFKESCDLQQ